MTTKTKKLARNYRVPQDRGEADAMIKELGVYRRYLVRLEADMNDKLAEIKDKHERLAEPHRAHADALLAGIETFCEANRERLTNGGKVKFVRFGNGDVKWRLRPRKVTVRGQDAVILAFKALGLSRFIRVSEEINKEAIRAEPEAAVGVKGISIGSEGEDFVVEPFEEQLVETGEPAHA